jgi:hypothetical protein
LYFAALRPAEAVNLGRDDCDLPERGWGRIYLSRTTPEVGKRYTNSGAAHDRKGLKHRPADEVRPVPIPPELVTILRWHLDEFGITPDGAPVPPGERRRCQLLDLRAGVAWRPAAGPGPGPAGLTASSPAL